MTSIIDKSGTKSLLYCLYTISFLFIKNKSKFKTRVSGYTPKAGDIIYFGSASDATHVGIVEKVSNKRVHTIEGNTSDCVARRDYSLTSTNIYGYGIPNYASK